MSGIARYTRSMSMITGLDLVGCTVADVPRSVAFYRDTLGLVPTMVHEEGAEFIFPDGTTLGIWNPGGDDVKPSYGVMFAVPDIHTMQAALRERGLNLADPYESPVCFMLFGADPDGNAFILHQRKTKDETPAPHYDRTPTSVNGIDIATYYTRDPERSIAFYRDVLGMTPTWTDTEGGNGAEFTLADGSTFGVWKTQGISETGAPGGGFMLAVDDPHAKVAELRSKGVEIGDPFETHSCFMALTKDPDGIDVIIHKRKQ